MKAVGRGFVMLKNFLTNFIPFQELRKVDKEVVYYKELTIFLSNYLQWVFSNDNFAIGNQRISISVNYTEIKRCPEFRLIVTWENGTEVCCIRSSGEQISENFNEIIH